MPVQISNRERRIREKILSRTDILSSIEHRDSEFQIGKVVTFLKRKLERIRSDSFEVRIGNL